jgi:hypothetical protein
MKKITMSILMLSLAIGCGKPTDLSNNQYSEYLSVQDLKSESLRETGFGVDSLDVYLPLPASAKNISVCEESGIDLSIWWSFDVPGTDIQGIADSAKGIDPCPFSPKRHDTTFWIPKGRDILGVHLKDKMTWIGVDLNTRRVYCLKYTM